MIAFGSPFAAHLRRALLPLTLFSAVYVTAVAQAATLNVYGPGGPAPAMKEAAQAYGAKHDIQVDIVAGPTPKWVDKAREDADIVYGGSEHMMSDFAKAMPGLFNLSDVLPLYLRPAAILVRPGNPKKIKGFKDLLQPGIKVLAVAGAGQTGLWEDLAGRTGDIKTVRAFRSNMVLPEAPNSAAARQQWVEHPEIDAWLIWNIWQVANPELADQVPVEEPWRIYRDMGVVLTNAGKKNVQAKDFIEFLQSAEGQRIFAKWGWSTGTDK